MIQRKGLRNMLAISTMATVACAAQSTVAIEPEDLSNDAFYRDGQSTLAERAALQPNKKRAKNVILFLVDGMDPTTVAAARIYDGQSRGEPGEENFLSFERFPYLAMAKTYNTDAQTPDSAGTMSAIVTGVKTKMGVVSLSDRVTTGNCASTKSSMVRTIGELAEIAGLSTGVVSTARLTHATPAAVYAHAADRDWERDTNLSAEAQISGCKDIARQLIEFPFGDGLEVALGGGRENFLPIDAVDPEYAEHKGGRRDGRNLADEWTKKSNNHLYAWNKKQFEAIDPATSPRILGLFERSHMQYEADRAQDVGGEPSLVEMTTKSIDILRRDKDGFFLMVEAGRVDHAHHASNAARALKDAQELSDAVAAARKMTNEEETLIIVTADHAHTLTFAGYPKKGSPILGLATASFEAIAGPDGFAVADDKKPYTTLGYANGPGTILAGQKIAGERAAPTPAEVADVNYRQQSAIPARSESHGGQDVTIYATGPRAYLFGGVVEQSYIFYVMENALDLKSRTSSRK